MTPLKFNRSGQDISCYPHPIIPLKKVWGFEIRCENGADDQFYENFYPEAGRTFHSWGEVISILARQPNKSPVTEIYALIYKPTVT